MSDRKIPDVLYITFEHGLHVGVFTDLEAVVRLNKARKKHSPVTIRYARADGASPEIR